MPNPPRVRTGAESVTAWDRYLLAIDEIAERLERITTALSDASVPFALVGGQAVALWVATKDPAAVRTTKDVDILLDRRDLSRARAAAKEVRFDYFEVMGVGMFLDRDDPNPRKGVHLVWAGEKVISDYALPSPAIDEREEWIPGKPVVTLRGLVIMKLMANHLHDLAHLSDMVQIGLIDHSFLNNLPAELAARLLPILNGEQR